MAKGILGLVEDVMNPFSGGAGPASKNAKKEQWHTPQAAAQNLQGLFGGGGGQSGGGQAPTEHRAGVSYDPEKLIDTYYPGLTPQQKQAVRAQLAPFEAQGGPEYHKALTELASQTPGLQAKSAMSAAFADPATQGGGKVDPLAQQLFFAKTIAPYLDHIRQQTQSLTGPLYAQAQSAIPAQFRGQMSPFITAMQGGEANLQGALSGAAAAGPSIDALMANVTADRQAQQRSYYESLAQKAAGGTGGTTDIAGLLQTLGIGQQQSGG